MVLPQFHTISFQEATDTKTFHHRVSNGTVPEGSFYLSENNTTA